MIKLGIHHPRKKKRKKGIVTVAFSFNKLKASNGERAW